MNTINQQITWVYTSDLERSHRFYSEVLGLALARDEGTARIYSIVDGAAIGVCETFDNRVVQPDGSMISLVTDDVDGWYQRLCRAGITTGGKPHHLEKFGIYTFFAEDPDGYVIEFQQFA
jgi:predicted enzyme related to lactoylglutathione lyase